MNTAPALTTGARLRSQVCATEVIVVRPPGRQVTLTCGGAPMTPLTAEVTQGSPVPGLDTGSLLGKRYTTAAEDAFEVLVTRPGAGTLADGGEPLVLKEARPLPSSD